MDRIGIVGIGLSEIRSTSPGSSFKELMYDAASAAYNDAGINPREDVDSFVSVDEDFNAGTSITDEYVPDQMGAMQRPVQTIAGDGLHGIITGALQILTGAFDIVVVEGHSKASNIDYPDEIMNLAVDPILQRPLLPHPLALLGLEKARYLSTTETTDEGCAAVVAKNRRQALKNPWATLGANLSIQDVLSTDPLSIPLRKGEVAQPVDGCVVLVLASEKKAKALKKKPIWITGMGWNNDAFAFELQDGATATKLAAQMAYKTAGIKNPKGEFDCAEVDDFCSFKELQHLEALGLYETGEAGRKTQRGETSSTGKFPVNPSGGSLGMGHLLDATGLLRTAMACFQLRGEAGPIQLKKATSAVVQSWRGVPTTSAAVITLVV